MAELKKLASTTTVDAKRKFRYSKKKKYYCKLSK